QRVTCLRSATGVVFRRISKTGGYVNDSRKCRAIPFLVAVVTVWMSLSSSELVAAKAKEAATAASSAASPPTDYNTIFKPIHFREIGPAAMGGRIDDFAVVENNPDIIYVGTASGGVFKTQNGGTTWEPVFDDESVSTIGDVT